MHKNKADIIEIFSSIQGEGLCLGVKQIFVRFKDCNLKCSFCDEASRKKPKRYSPHGLMKEVKHLELSCGPHHSVSLTGGEPLLYSEFLKVFLRLLKKDGFTTYLETNGTLPSELAGVITLVDIVAMDFKLPSATGERSFWKEHVNFLKIASAKKVFVKAVVTPKTLKRDVEKAVLLIKDARIDAPLILQPATPVKKTDRFVNKRMLAGFLEVADRNNFENIRIIPQIHKILNVR